MNKNNNRTSQGVGYVRTSLHKQAVAGDLDRQTEKLRKGAQELGIDLERIHSDIASGAGLDMSNRPGLKDAIKEAKERHVPVVVTDVTRITRDPKKFLQLLEILERHQLPFISLNEPDVKESAEHLRRVEDGKSVLGKTRAGTKQAMAQKKAEGIAMGSPGDKQAAARASVRARRYRSAEIVERIADVLAEDPLHGMLSRKEFAKLLNDREIFSGWSREWTATSIVQPRQKAMNELRRRVILQSEIDAGREESFSKASSPTSPELAGAIEGAKKFRAAIPTTRAIEPPVEAEEAEMRRHPNFGRF